MTLWWPLRSRPFSTLKTACGVLVASLPNSTTPHIATVLHPCQADQSQKGGPLDAGPEPIRISEQAQGQDHRTRQRPERVRRLGEPLLHRLRSESCACRRYYVSADHRRNEHVLGNSY